MQPILHVFMLIWYGFKMSFYRDTFDTKYGKIFVFKDYYRLAINFFKIAVIVIILLLFWYKYNYVFIPGHLYITYGVLFLLTCLFTCYTIGLYSIYPLKLEHSGLYQLLLNEFGKDTDDACILNERTYYGLAVLLKRLDLADKSKTKYPDIQDLLRKLTNFKEQDDGPKNTSLDLDDPFKTNKYQDKRYDPAHLKDDKESKEQESSKGADSSSSANQSDSSSSSAGSASSDSQDSDTSAKK